MPGFCPHRDTERHYEPVKVPDMSFYADNRKKATRVTCSQYVLREHTIAGIFYAPTMSDPLSRPSDLMRGQRLGLLAFKTLVAVDMCMYITEYHPGLLEGRYYFLAMTVVYGGASFAKAFYQSALKRTFFASLKISKLVARNIDLQTYFSNTAQLSVEVTMGRHTAVSTAATNASRGDEWSWEGEELSVSVSADYADIQVCRLDEPCIARSVRSVQRTQLEVAKLVTAGLTVGAEHSLVLPFGQGGELSLHVRMVRAQPITPLAFFAAFFKPVLDCLLTQLLCLPCYICIQGVQILAHICRAISRKRRGSAKSYKLLDGEEKSEKPEKPKPWGLSGHAWRLLLRGVVFTYTAVVTLQFVFLYNQHVEEREKLEEAATLVIHAKFFSYVLAEPMSLAMTWATMRFFCWRTLPKVKEFDAETVAGGSLFPGPHARILPREGDDCIPNAP